MFFLENCCPSCELIQNGRIIVVLTLTFHISKFVQHLFASEQREEIIKSAIDHAGNYIGISLRIRKEPLEFEQYLNLRFGKYSTDESITSLAEFIVQKISPRHSVRLCVKKKKFVHLILTFFFNNFLMFQFCLKEPVKRVLALTETCLVERDPATYNIATLKPLGEVSLRFK